jgi:hypothetical protein
MKAPHALPRPIHRLHSSFVRWLVVPAILALHLAKAEDPLPSWRDTAPKKAIIGFVERVTKQDSPDFIPIPERIATFDNDGTLWSEQPTYFQALFIFDRIQALAPKHPEWRRREPFASVLKRNYKNALAGGQEAIVELVMATYTRDPEKGSLPPIASNHGAEFKTSYPNNLTVEEYAKIVDDWLATARHPQTGRPYTEMVYQPMLELLAYLQANNFKTYIATGGGVEFVRCFSEKVYGIPPEQVIGSSLVNKFELRDGVPTIVRVPQVDFFDDKAGKPIAIQRFIGRRPVIAFGNSDGDQQMLEWTASGPGARFVALIHHTDAEREWAYDRKSPVGTLDKALDEATTKGWAVVSMKDDWATIYPIVNPAAQTPGSAPGSPSPNPPAITPTKPEDRPTIPPPPTADTKDSVLLPPAKKPRNQ